MHAMTGSPVESNRFSSSPGPAGRIAHPCDACKRSKLRCDQRRPTCDTCMKRAKKCEYSAADGYTDGRVRKFHRRSRNGCSHCKTRRVRCDEAKPVCGGCRRKGAADLCMFPPDTERSSRSASPTSPAELRADGGGGEALRFTGCAPLSATNSQATATTADASRPQRFTGCAPVTSVDNRATTATTEPHHRFTGCSPITAAQSFQKGAMGGPQHFTGCSPITADSASTNAATSEGQRHFTGCAPIQPSSMRDQDSAMATSSVIPDLPDLPGQPAADDTGPQSSNVASALSLWNPSAISSASPNTLFASLFGTPTIDTFQPASIYDLPLGDDLGSGGFQQSQIGFDTPNNSSASNFFAFDLGRTDQSATLSGGQSGTLTEYDPFSLDYTGSNGSTPISLNSNTAYNSNLTNYVNAEYRNRPEHPAYLFQLQMIEDMEQLTPFFPSLEQRHQFRHFFLETSKSLLVAPTPQHSNPFLCHFSHLALSAPAGQSLTHDAFRFSLLSLASLDIGIKMSMAMPGMSHNAMYSTSDEQRTEAHKRLIAASISGILKEDPADAELVIATVIALSIRDRLAGCQEWEPPLQIGRDVVVNAGGSAAFINARPTADRRFLVEQMAVLELIGYLTIWVSPKLLAWDNDWFLSYTGEEGHDHLQIVYGWTRPVILYAARSMILCGEARDIEAMREAQPKPGYRRLRDIIEMRMTSLVKRVRDFLPEGEIVKAAAMIDQHPPEVLVGVLGIQACMDLCLRTVILMEDIKSPQVQSLVKSILDISDESISRDRYAGLLLPLSWADGVAFDPGLKQRAKVTLRALKRHYHLNQELLERIINIDWATLNNIGLGDWEAFLRKHGYYVPCF